MDFLDTINKYWVMGVTFISIVISYTMLKAQNTDQEKRLTTLEARCTEYSHSQTQIDIKLAEIQMDLKWIKQSLKTNNE